MTMASEPEAAPDHSASNGEGTVSVADGGGSVVSESTQTTQTRFSFYNAEDFVNKSPQQAAAKVENAQRFTFCTAKDNKADISTTSGPVVPDPNEDNTNEILKSLQAHEQQRNEILQPAPPRSSRNAVDRSMHSSASESSNPYEDAIKDALELLRRHRTGITLNRPAALDTSAADEDYHFHNPQQEVSFSQEDMEALSRSLQEVNMSADDLPAVSANSDLGNATGGLGEAYQAEIEARRKQRQERMAKYANRLAELKQEAGTPNPKRQTFTPKVDINGTDWDETPLMTHPATSRSAPLPSTRLEAAKTFESEASSATAEDVQRGVEKVLLAILERANSRGRGDDESRDQDATNLNNEEKKGSPLEHIETDEDVLVQAMSDLLGAPSTSSLGSSSPNRNAIQYRIEEAGKQAVLAAASDNDPPSTDRVESENHATEMPIEQHLPQDELDEMVLNVLSSKDKSSAEEDSFDRRVRSILSQDKTNQSNGHTGKDDDDDEEEEQQQEEDTEADDINTGESNASEDEDQTTNEGDETARTGSYVDDESSSGGEGFNEEEYSDEDDDDEEEEDEEAFVDTVNESYGELDGVLGPLSKKAGGTTGVVLETNASEEDSEAKSPTILESLSAAMSMVTGRDNQETLDKYATDYDNETDLDGDTDDEEEDESTELMRTLCAHLLPVGVSQSTKLLDNRPAWDESNPDEAGYRIIRLTLPQLSAVESAFDRMVTGLKQNSEKKLSVAGTDEAFERDLRAAEELLDESEKQSLKETEPSKSATEVSAEPEPFEFAKEVGEGESLQDFPGVKPTGRGEMGDLEYFHLPIIFKSHVTGFEPTKDMYLEPGNVVAGQYLVEGELGSAAFSTAYRCIDLNSGEGPDDQEEVCLKVIKNTKDFFDQSLDEIKILELLRQTGMCHEKCIVEMRTFFYHREHLIIVTELLRQNLFEFGKFIIDNDEEPYFTMTRLAYVTRQVLIALEFVHRLGLVHSDVKPENILLSSYSRARVKLIDFGSSCYLTDRQSSYIQSRSYRAPEVVLGLPYDGRIDIWSLGCVVAEMFTGEVTFQNDSIVSMLSRIEAICGTFPRHMIAQGRQSGRFFATSGLLFEKVSSSDKEDSDHSDESGDEESSEPKREYVDIFQPKTTTLSARLGFSADLLERYDSSAELSREESRQALFVDFVRKLLTIDPDVRPTACQALQHPWMRFAESLTEESIRYPSS